MDELIVDTPDCRYFVTGREDSVVKAWDISDGSLLLTVADAGEETGMIMCCCDNEVVVASSKRGIVVISFETGELTSPVRCIQLSSSCIFLGRFWILLISLYSSQR